MLKIHWFNFISLKLQWFSWDSPNIFNGCAFKSWELLNLEPMDYILNHSIQGSSNCQINLLILIMDWYEPSYEIREASSFSSDTSFSAMMSLISSLTFISSEKLEIAKNFSRTEKFALLLMMDQKLWAHLLRKINDLNFLTIFKIWWATANCPFKNVLNLSFINHE